MLLPRAAGRRRKLPDAAESGRLLAGSGMLPGRTAGTGRQPGENRPVGNRGVTAGEEPGPGRATADPGPDQ